MIDIASAAIAVLSREFQEELIKAIQASSTNSLSPMALRLELISQRFRAELEAALYDSQIGAFIVGASKSIAPLASEAGLTPLLPGSFIYSAPPSNPFSILYPAGGGPMIEFPIIDKAVKQLQDAGVMMPEDYYNLSGAARRDAFTITADITQSTIEQVRDILSQNVETATDRQAFMRDVAQAVKDLPIDESHLEQVFRNNVNGAYSDGAESVLADPMVEDAFPYRAYYPIRDDRARKTHLILEKSGLDGTNVYHYRDPVWLMFRPPWDWNCRCGWTPLTIRRAAKKGVRAAKVWLESGIEPPNQFVEWPTLDGEPFYPSPSWQRLAA